MYISSKARLDVYMYKRCKRGFHWLLYFLNNAFDDILFFSHYFQKSDLLRNLRKYYSAWLEGINHSELGVCIVNLEVT